MDNLLQWIESNQALIIGSVLLLTLFNMVLLVSLSSRLAAIKQEIMALIFATKREQQTKSGDSVASGLSQPLQKATSIGAQQSLPEATLIEKAIALITSGASVDQIQSELGIDKDYLEILAKQHRS